MVPDTVNSSAELWAAVRLVAVLGLKQRALPHETDDEIMQSVGVLDAQEKAERKIKPKTVPPAYFAIIPVTTLWIWKNSCSVGHPLLSLLTVCKLSWKVKCRADRSGAHQ